MFDIRGRLMRTLVDTQEGPGRHQVVWDARDNHGRRAAAGVYPYRLRVGGHTLTRKLILLPH